MAGTLAGYTHRQWRDEAQDLIKDLETLQAALQHMSAGLQYVGAGTTQRQEQAKWSTRVGDLTEQGRRVLEAHDGRLTRVGEAQAAAGGQTEVAQNKRYNR